jgi:starch-binding outer membrane protein, SusD/RagB family
MKKISCILIVIIGILIGNSCSDEYFDLNNPNEILPEAFLKNEVQVQAAVNAAYANLQTIPLYGRYMFFMMDNMAQENKGNPQLESDKVPYTNFTFSSSEGNIANFWGACFKGINKANFVIGNENKINAIPEEDLSQVKKIRFFAEVRFLRGLYYFMLVNRFGDVPLYKASPSSIEGIPRSPKAEIYKLIVEDLTFAAANLLSKDNPDAQKGRANKGAAQALLGKVLLYQKQYGPALAAFNSLSGYALEANFYDNFMEETEHGIESIFEVEYNRALGTGNKWDSSGIGPAEATFRGQEYGNLGWYNVYPSDNLLDEYEPGDKRFDETFYTVGSKYFNNTLTMTAANFGSSNGVRRAGWKKYQNYYKQISEQEESGINFKVIRFADVLLMKAECENEVGTQAAAVGYINQVRARAGLAALPTTLTKDQVFKALIHERKVELAGEQVRFDDIIRWNLASTELAGSGFTAGKNELWPVPERERSTNPNASQNPGY